MFKRLIALDWKKFVRSYYFRQSVLVKILLAFAALYFSALFLVLGIGAYFGLKEGFPGKDPVVLVNDYLLYWFLLDILFRFFLQKLPVLNIKPLLTFPLKRKTLIHFLLGRTTVSFFNLLPLFFFLPFGIVLLTQGYPPLNVISWFLAMLFFELSINYLNFLINKIDTVFYVLFSVFLVLAGLDYYNVLSITAASGIFFNAIFDDPVACLIPLLLMILLYRRNYAFIRHDFYIDGAISKKTKQAKTANLNWLERFGEVSIFLKNDLRLIWRNKRPKSVLWMSFIFLFYGLIFFTQDTYRNMPGFLTFASLFITGGFLFTFGQLVPSWDSEYYKLLMSQNIPYRKYLESKWYLMVTGTVVSFLLSMPYLYFGWRIYGMIVAGALFNIGLNTFITLYAGALNRVPVKLDVKAKAFGNIQGFNATQFLLNLPKMILPVLLFYIPYKFINFQTGLVVLGLSGILGLCFKNYFFNLIENIYQKGKYKTIAAYENAE